MGFWKKKGPALVAAGALAAGVCGAAASRAAAEIVPPAQAIADDGVFLEHIAPPAQPAAVCIVDSGVDLNPDTAGEVVYRTALDGGDPGDVAPDKHGTLMAMMAAAPINGWGMVGAAPGLVKIVSVRVEEAGEAEVPFSVLRRGVTICMKRASEFRVAVVSLSLAGTGRPHAGDTRALQETVDAARAYGLLVIGAEGNSDSGTSSAAVPGVFIIGAATPRGGPCPFSSTGSAVSLWAPGCDLDATNDQSSAASAAGSSEATAIASAIATAVRSYVPTMSNEAATQAMIASPTLDSIRVFTAAGLAPLVPHPAAPGAAVAALPAPRVTLGRVRHRLRLRVNNLPNGALMQVTISRESKKDFGHRISVLSLVTTRSLVLVPLVAGRERIAVRYMDPDHRRQESARVTIRA